MGALRVLAAGGFFDLDLSLSSEESAAGGATMGNVRPSGESVAVELESNVGPGLRA